MAAAKKTKDLTPKKAETVKGGILRKPGNNDNFTLVRAAKPRVTKDLSPSKNPKGGKKER